MNELKPEDVVRALDILDKMDFFYGQRAGRELWSKKPFEVQEQDVADFAQDVVFVKNLIVSIVAILEQWDADLKTYEAMLMSKDAEIERLKGLNTILKGNNHKLFRLGYEDAISEFAERLKKQITPLVNASIQERLDTLVWVLDLIDQIAKKMKGEHK